ncbi:MAG: LCP family protein, partial [Candidatus Eremiobacteraeota bacterium]|nr:LCP family protein [Candidatus Eremiobacteraeota bacterium]
MNPIIKRVALVLGLIVLGLGSTLAGYAIFEHRNPLTAFTQMFVPTPLQVFGKPNILVLVEGLDYDYTANDIEFSTNSRSDAIWAVNMDFTNKRIFQLSVPRDTVATMPNGSQAKINQAQSEGGVNEAKTVISQFLGIPGFDRYVVLRIDATKEFVTALGGVDVNVK